METMLHFLKSCAKPLVFQWGIFRGRQITEIKDLSAGFNGKLIISLNVFSFTCDSRRMASHFTGDEHQRATVELRICLKQTMC